MAVTANSQSASRLLGLPFTFSAGCLNSPIYTNFIAATDWERWGRATNSNKDNTNTMSVTSTLTERELRDSRELTVQTFSRRALLRSLHFNASSRVLFYPNRAVRGLNKWLLGWNSLLGFISQELQVRGDVGNQFSLIFS